MNFIRMAKQMKENNHADVDLEFMQTIIPFVETVTLIVRVA